MTDRARAKSLEQLRLNNLPQLLRRDGQAEVWSVCSRSTFACRHCGAMNDGATSPYIVTVDEAGDLACDCPASVYCWHRDMVGLARAGAIGFHSPLLVRR